MAPVGQLVGQKDAELLTTGSNCSIHLSFIYFISMILNFEGRFSSTLIKIIILRRFLFSVS